MAISGRTLLISALTLLTASSARARQSSDVRYVEISIERRVPSCEGCPESRVIFRRTSAEFQCLGGCAVPSTQLAKYPAADFAVLVKGLENASFFEIPRDVSLATGRICIDCGVVTITYRDQRRIHEVVIPGRVERLPKLDALVRQLQDAAHMFDRYASPSAEHYRALLKEGWDPNEVLDGAGNTMLNFANQDARSVELLLANGARVNKRALETTYVAEALALLWDAANMSPASREAESLLLFAASNNWRENVKWIIEKGVNVDALDPDSGRTPLMAATRTGNREVMDLLLQRKARTDLRDANGNSLLWYAAETDRNSGVLASTLQRSLPVDAINKDGRTALMHAAESCQAGNVRILLAAGASASLRDKGGKRALDLVPAGRADRAPGCSAARLALAGGQ